MQQRNTPDMNWKHKNEIDVVIVHDEVVIVEQGQDIDLNKRHKDNHPWHAVVAGMRIVCHGDTRDDVIGKARAKIKRKKEVQRLQQYFAEKKAKMMLAKKHERNAGCRSRGITRR